MLNHATILTPTVGSHLKIKIKDNINYSEEYEKRKSQYDKLGINLHQALTILLKESGIPFLSINYRIKDLTSFIEKTERKKYNSPFEEIEDICGIRIICYYQSDVEKIVKIISNEFEIIENQDKEELLNDDQFGYRSTHFIAKIKKEWLSTPNYKGLENLKAEIQVRTILMHAWAEIEHKLAYKSKTQIPKQFKRKLFRMSAKLEEADEQFEDLKKSISDYKKEVIQLSTKKKKSDEIELNLDSLQAFLDSNFNERKKIIQDTANLVDELKKYKISLSDLIESYKIVKPYIPEIENEIFPDQSRGTWTQTGIVREIMDLTHEKWRETRDVPEFAKEIDRKWSKKILKNK